MVVSAVFNRIRSGVSIVIATYGDGRWSELARNRAIPAAQKQLVEVISVHEDYGTLASCRNRGASMASGEWIIFCDADDELEDGYVQAMMAGSGELRYPSVRRMVYAKDNTILMQGPIELKKHKIVSGNYMVIGTMLQKDLFAKVGGFNDLPIWEDWELFMRMMYAGAESVYCRDAVYRVHVNDHGRNRHPVNPAEMSSSILDGVRKWAYEFDGGKRLKEMSL